MENDAATEQLLTEGREAKSGAQQFQTHDLLISSALEERHQFRADMRPKDLLVDQQNGTKVRRGTAGIAKQVRRWR